MAREYYQANVIRYVESKAPGEVIWIDDLRAVVPAGASRSGVRSVMQRLVDQGHLSVKVKAQAWIVGDPEKAANPFSDGRVFQEIRTLASGKILLECTDGRLYVASELEV